MRLQEEELNWKSDKINFKTLIFELQEISTT